ncbi:MAG: transcriptional repressor [Acidobacteriota bacterium]
MHHISSFKNYLSGKNLKKTGQRFQILHEIFSRHSHFKVSELLAGFRKRKIKVSRATIYRTLQHLIASGMVRSVEAEKGWSYYEHCHGHPHHDHLLCLECGSVFEFRSGKLEEIQEKICLEMGFLPLRHSHEIQGICEKCRTRDATSMTIRKSR